MQRQRFEKQITVHVTKDDIKTVEEIKKRHMIDKDADAVRIAIRTYKEE
jgi:hypothetical protein